MSEEFLLEPIILDATGQDIVNALLRIGGDVVHYSQDTGKTSEQKAQARANIGAGTPVEIVNNVTSTDTNKALSANMGKVLKDAIDALEAQGTFFAKYNIDAPASSTPIADIAQADTSGKTIIAVGMSNGKVTAIYPIIYNKTITSGTLTGIKFGMLKCSTVNDHITIDSSFVEWGGETPTATTAQSTVVNPITATAFPEVKIIGDMCYRSDENKQYVWNGTEWVWLAKGADIPQIVNNVTSTDEDKALSAKMGKELQDQINNLQGVGRFLSIWNCITGLPTTNPTTLPYAYKTGDYYRIGTVTTGTKYAHTVHMEGVVSGYSATDVYNIDFTIETDSEAQFTIFTDVTTALHEGGYIERYSLAATGTITIGGVSQTVGGIGYSIEGNCIMLNATDMETALAQCTGADVITDSVVQSQTGINYKPNGNSYDGTASTTVETEDVSVGYVYYYDGTSWMIQGASGGNVQDVQYNSQTLVDSESGIANITDDLLKQVKYVEQTLTDGQKAQARTNIGAGKDEFFIATVGTTRYAEVEAAYNAGKIIIGRRAKSGGVTDTIDIVLKFEGNKYQGQVINKEVSAGGSGFTYQKLGADCIYWKDTNEARTGVYTLVTFPYAPTGVTNNPQTPIGYIVRNTADNNRLYIGDGAQAKKIAYFDDLSEGAVEDVQINGTSIVVEGVANIPLVSTNSNGIMTSAQNDKLAGIESGAEVNDPNTVLCSAQTLTTEQQTQARSNIGAISSSEVGIAVEF